MRVMKRVYLFILKSLIGFFFFTSVVVSGLSANETVPLEIKKVFIVEESLWPPFTFDRMGTPTRGVAWELMNSIFSSLDIEVDMKLYPMVRILKYIKEGRRDLISVISKNKARKAYLEFSAPLFRDRGRIYYSANHLKKVEWHRFEDLVPYRIGIVRGHNYGQNFENAVKQFNLNVDPVPTNELNFRKLMNGRVDLLLSSESGAEAFKKAYPEYKEHLKAAKKPYHSYIFYIGFSKKTPAKNLIPDVNSVIQHLYQDGTVGRILEKYQAGYLSLFPDSRH